MSSAPRETGITQDQLAGIHSGMDVVDAAGERIGKVADLRFGDPDATEVGDRDPATMTGEGLVMAMGVHREPNVPAGLVGRLLRAGYIKIDDRRHFRPDHHYYALIDEIVSIEADTVRLSKTCRELIASLN